MRVGIAADHEGFALKEQLATALRAAGYELIDFGAHDLTPGDDYPDFVVPLAKALAGGEVQRGIAICGSGVGVSVAANKVHDVKAGLCHDHFSARQGVEDDNMNVLCLGSQVVGPGRVGLGIDPNLPGRSVRWRRTTSATPVQSSGAGEFRG